MKKIIQISAISLISYGVLLLCFFLNYCWFMFVSLFFSLKNPFVPSIAYAVFALFIVAGTYFIEKSRLYPLLKAGWFSVPVAALLLTTGIVLYQTSVLVYVVGVIIYAALLYLLYRLRRPWMYYYAVTFVSILFLIMGLTGTEI